LDVLRTFRPAATLPSWISRQRSLDAHSML
jgi:hypothetical protein